MLKKISFVLLYLTFFTGYNAFSVKMSSMELIQKLEQETLEVDFKKLKGKEKQDWISKKLTLISLYRLVGKPDLAEKIIEMEGIAFKGSKNAEWLAHREWYCSLEKHEDFCKNK